MDIKNDGLEKGSSFMFDIYINYINDLRGVPHLIKGFLRG